MKDFERALRPIVFRQRMYRYQMSLANPAGAWMLIFLTSPLCTMGLATHVEVLECQSAAFACATMQLDCSCLRALAQHSQTSLLLLYVLSLAKNVMIGSKEVAYQ